MKNKRLYIVVTPEMEERLTTWAGKLGISRTQLAAMAVQAGLNSILLAVAPAETVPPETWAKMMKAYENMAGKGVKLDEIDSEDKSVLLRVLPTNGDPSSK